MIIFKNNNNFQYFEQGKRKSSLAKVFFFKELGSIYVNKKKFKDYFISIKNAYEIIKEFIILSNFENKCSLNIFVYGGGIFSQLDAIKFALIKLFYKMDKNYKYIIKTKDYSFQDIRIKERRKYGLKKARKAAQFNKR